MSKEINLIIFVNGFTHKCQPFKEYWSKDSVEKTENKEILQGSEFISAANKYFFKDSRKLVNLFVDGSCRQGSIFNYLGFTTAQKRFKLGRKFGKIWLNKIQEKNEINLENCVLSFVTHSMGGAYAEGMISILLESNLKIDKVIHLSTADAYYIKPSKSIQKIKRIQLGIDRDWTIKRFADPFTRGKKLMIPEIDLYSEIVSNHQEMIPNVSPKDQKKYNYHAWTKWDCKVFDVVKILESINETNQINNNSCIIKDGYQFSFLKLN